MTDNIAREDVVEEHWPYDGPHSAESVTTAARTLCELVRYLNNATRLNGGHRPTVSDIGEIVGSISGSVFGLEQLVNTLFRSLERYRDDASDLYSTSAEDPKETVTRALQNLDKAEQASKPLLKALDGAYAAINRLGHRVPGDEQEASR